MVNLLTLDEHNQESLYIFNIVFMKQNNKRHRINKFKSICFKIKYPFIVDVQIENSEYYGVMVFYSTRNIIKYINNSINLYIDLIKQELLREEYFLNYQSDF